MKFKSYFNYQLSAASLTTRSQKIYLFFPLYMQSIEKKQLESNPKL